MNQESYQIDVEIAAQYVPEQSDTARNEYAFAYTVRITNRGSVPSQLISRHWIIEDQQQQVIEVNGLGVVGHQPLLQPGETFEYTSGSRIHGPVGTMRGSYFFVAENGHRFDVEIPQFALCMPQALH